MNSHKRRHIFALCRELKLDDTQRRTIQFSVTGKESSSELTNSEADAVIKVLYAEKKKMFRHQPRPRKKMTAQESLRRGNWKNKLPNNKKVISLMTAEQYRKIQALSIMITGEFKESQINKFTMRQYKKPLGKLTAVEAIRLIESQKQILKRKTKEQINEI